MNLRFVLGLAVLALGHALLAQPAPDSHPPDLPDLHWHLTARPWQPVNARAGELLDQMDQAAHALAPFQYWDATNAADVQNGALIDPIDHTEIQYGTPTFAFNVAALLSKGRAADLVTQGARALDRSTLNIATGYANQGHGEFFCAPMVKAIRLLEALQSRYPEVITPERLKTWKERLATPRTSFMYLRVRQNWRTFAMDGEWLRQQDGYITDGVDWIEKCWTNWDEGDQRARLLEDQDQYHLKPCFYLYHDNRPNPPGSRANSPTYSGADPQTFTYNGAVAANLLDLLAQGYNGPSADEMSGILGRSMRSSLLLLSGSGEAPAGGRTGEHCWDDTIYANAFELMARREQREGNLRLAGEFQHAAGLLLKSHARFQQENGLFSITKNQYPASWKVHYATWSGVVNYENFDMGCFAGTLLADQANIAEQPAPAEIGGYAMQLDPSFAQVFLNAGGLQMQICTRGETDNYGLVQWHTLGITRFSRTGWDGRLGPGAGCVNNDFSDGVSFSPVFFEAGKWQRVCLEPKRFQGGFKAEFVHPLLLRGVYTIAPVGTNTGPAFQMHLTLTPDGALVDTVRMSGTNKFGVVWPLLEFDGRTVLNKKVGRFIASTAYPRISGVVNRLPGDAHQVWRGVDGGEGGASEIGFQYALEPGAKTTRRAGLMINGVAQPALVFLSTGGLKSGHQLYVPVTLAPGTKNTISLDAGSNDQGLTVDELRVHPALRSTTEPDQENFIALQPTHQLDASAPAVRGGYGDFLPVRVTDDQSQGGPVETFVYPRSAGDPEAESVRSSFVRNGEDFSSVLGRVQGTLYVGRTSAGGFGKAIDLAGDGRDDVIFDKPCAFILQLRNGRVTALEADRSVSAMLGGRKLTLAPFSPAVIE
jgi:hypothetical protein